MKDTVKGTRLNRRDFLRVGALALGAYAMPSLHNKATCACRCGDLPFPIGASYPWIAYGHDYGKNAWGHDGLITGGWTYQTYSDSQGFTDTRYCTECAHTGRGGLCISADLVGQDANKARGEVYVDLQNHAPPGVSVPVDLENVTARCWLRLPEESAGPSSARNGVQLLFKSEGWHSFYSPWENIQPEWENDWHEFMASPSDPFGDRDPEFDPTKVIAIGVKVAINDESDATLSGLICLDDYVLDTDSPIIFDFEQLEVERDFAAMRQVVESCSTMAMRVFILADGRASPEFSTTGEVTGFDEYFYQDFDALLEAATRHRILLIPVLLDFWWCDLPQDVNGVQLGGHSDVIREVAKQETFLSNALRPLVERYATHPQILAWEVMNEPEWAMQGIPEENPVGDPVTVEQMQGFVAACADVVHTYSSHLVTVGSARRQWVHYWQGLGLDLYQFHWYDAFAAQEPFPWPPCSELGLDKPCLVGEVPTANTAHSVREYLDAARDGGYCGLLVWSYRPVDAFSNFADAIPHLRKRCLYLPLITREYREQPVSRSRPGAR